MKTYLLGMLNILRGTKMEPEIPMVIGKIQFWQSNPETVEPEIVIKTERKKMKDRLALQTLIKRMELKLHEKRIDQVYMDTVEDAHNRLNQYFERIDKLKDIERNWKLYNYLFGDGTAEDALEV